MTYEENSSVVLRLIIGGLLAVSMGSKFCNIRITSGGEVDSGKLGHQLCEDRLHWLSVHSVRTVVALTLAVPVKLYSTPLISPVHLAGTSLYPGGTRWKAAEPAEAAEVGASAGIGPAETRATRAATPEKMVENFIVIEVEVYLVIVFEVVDGCVGRDGCSC